MHFYQFNIGDYAKATRHLNNLEDLAYRRLMDLYYDSEKALPSDVKKLARLVNMRENEEEIKTVLDDFFFLEDDEYHQNRIEREVLEYQAKAETARLNGKKGGRPKKTNPVKSNNPEITQSVILANPEETGSKAKQELRTNNQETLNNNQVISDGKKTPSKRFTPPTQNEVYDYMGIYSQEKGKTISQNEPEKFVNFYESKGWVVGKNKMKDWKSAARNWVGRIEDQAAQKKGKWDNQESLGNDFESMFTEGEIYND